MADGLLATRIRSKRLAPLHVDKYWYIFGVKVVKTPFHTFGDHSVGPQSASHWTFIQNRCVRGDKANELLGVERFFSTNYGTGSAVEDDPLHCDRVK